MTEKQFDGVKIICSGNLPVEIDNEETGETETFHMVQKEDILFVSEELYSALHKRCGEGM